MASSAFTMMRGAAATAMIAMAFCMMPAYAEQWDEVSDAGELPATAQVTSGLANQALTAINGTIVNGINRDMYQIMITDALAFSASTVGGDSEGPSDFDAILALFDTNGIGVYLNDDGVVNLGDSILPAAHPLGPSSAGIYYIAIFHDESLPLSGAAATLDDLIFPILESPFTEVLGPVGAGGSAPISGWGIEDTDVFSAPYTINLTGAEFAQTSQPPGSVVSAVLPTSRSVQVGNPATAFATIVNAGSSAVVGCGIAPITNVQADFSYQTTAPDNTLMGTANTPADIAVAANQSYLFSFVPTSAFGSTDVQLAFDCSNTDPAPITVGLNTLLLVADSGPTPDVVALSATPSNDGIVSLASSGAFAVASVNVGVAATITVSADTGNATLPLAISLCETDPGTGMCVNPTTPASTVTTTIEANATPTFSVFVTSTDDVPFDPANNRIFARFKDAGGVTRGSTSVAVRTLNGE